MTQIDIDHLRTWVGREGVAEQLLAPFPAQALAGALDCTAVPSVGEALPLPWHWLYFLDTPTRTGTGADGHAQRGGFLPPVPLPRRMWAAGSIENLRPLTLGEPARKRSTVSAVDLKEGKSGPLVFVTVLHELQQSGQVCLREEQSIVYRDAPTEKQPPAPGQPSREPAVWQRTLRPDPVLLFRYSALTYNSHRIHYDRDYATGQELYPALVVHGPLLATLLLDLLRRGAPGASIRRFSFRAMRPAFDNEALQLCGRPEGKAVSLWTADPQGFVGMKASVELA